MADAGRNPLDQLVDLVLYAPVGLALTAQESLPELVAKGRQRVNSQVTLARMIGQFAVREGEREARRRIGGISETLSGLGLLPQQPPAPAPAPAPSPAAAPAVAPAVADQAGPQQPSGTAPQAAPAPAASPNGKGHAAEPEERPRAELAIPGYDTLSASQVVQRLAGLSVEELDAVRSYEASTRGRRTILSKIAQLQAGPPA